MSLIPFIVLELLMKNARHSNPINWGEMTNRRRRGGNDEPKKSHVTLFQIICMHLNRHFHHGSSLRHFRPVRRYFSM